MNTPHHPAIVLSSGGLDSTTCLAIARADGFDPLYSLSFDYGQRNRCELDAAKRVAERMRVAEHRVISIDLRQFGGSALTGDLPVPRDRDEGSVGRDVPLTYVPARNTIFLSYALAWGEVLDCTDLYIGVNNVDYSGYPDCRPEFIAAFEQVANLGTTLGTQPGRRYRIHTPLMHLAKAQIIQKGLSLGIDYALTHTCYGPTDDGLACGHCEACHLRRRGFEQAGVPDPTRYAPA